MEKETLRKCLMTCNYACYYGSTRQSRLAWNLRYQAGVTLKEANDFIRAATDARLLEWTRYAWVAATPMLVGIISRFDSLYEAAGETTPLEAVRLEQVDSESRYLSEEDPAPESGSS